MFPALTPSSSPLSRYGSKSSYDPQLYQPSRSSPLSATSSPTHNVQRRRRQYKSQTSLRSLPAANLLGGLVDTPQKEFLRERFKARCLERAKEGRKRAVQKSRDDSSENGSSSDGYGDGDYVMDDEDEDVCNDEIYRRVMMNETRRSQYAKRLSFEQEFGSSIDPAMYEDMNTLEWELTGQASALHAPSPPMDDLDDALIQEYLAELEEIEFQKDQQKMYEKTDLIDIDTEDPSALEREFAADAEEQPSPSRSLYSDFQMSPPSSPSRPETSLGSHTLALRSTSTWNCPFCTALTPRSHIACSSCVIQYALDHARFFWFDVESHPAVQHSEHIPLATKTPNESGVGIVMLCGASGCDWCFAL
ncbi:hypothetical protein K439DRAFT_1627473 [Ramaria rubella]|nr:hypothetical protein K439DRAFT_1627473 [Ramaria rubella]